MAVSKNFPNPFGKLASRFRVLRQKLPRQASVIAAQHFTENFRRQGILNNGAVIEWKPRQTGHDGRAILVKSGRLRRSIRPAATLDEARVINDAPYAAIHNEGGEYKGTSQVRSHMRRRFESEEVSAPRARKEKWVKKQTGSHQVKAHERSHNVTMPARPFMVTTPDLENELERFFFDEIDKLLK